MNGRLHRLLSVTVYPAVVGSCVGVAIAGIRAGIALPFLLIGLTAAAALVAALLERVLPYRAEWSRSRGDVVVDLCFNASSGLSSELGRALAIVAFSGASLRLAASL